MRLLSVLIIIFATHFAQALAPISLQAAIGNRAACFPLSADWAPKAGSLQNVWHFDDVNGTLTASDSIGANTANASSTSTAIFEHIGKQALSGSPMTYYTTTTQYLNPQTFSLMAWFKTSTTTGGILIEFGLEQTGGISSYDRFIAMENSGQIIFGNNGGLTVTRSPLSYNDSKWHLVVATSTSGSQVLYIDGAVVATTSAGGSQGYNGYWRIGNGRLDGWPVTVSSYQYSGALNEVAVWTSVLTAQDVKKIFNQQLCGLFNK